MYVCMYVCMYAAAWDHFAFSMNITYLRDSAYPLLKGSAMFFLDYMFEDRY